MTYQKPFISKQTVVKAFADIVQVNTYGGTDRGWMVRTVNRNNTVAELNDQLLRLVELSIVFRGYVIDVYRDVTGTSMRQSIWDDLDDIKKLEYCKLAQNKLTQLN